MIKNILIGAGVLGLFISSYVALVGGQSGQLSQSTDLTQIENQISRLERKVFASGGTTNYDNLNVRGLQVGTTTTSTTTTSRLIFGACELIGTNVNLTASSSAPFDCSAPGVIATDFVIAQAATSTGGLINNAGGLYITGAKASSTSGFITFIVVNLGGTTRIPSNFSVGSSTAYVAFATTTPLSLGL